MSRIRGRDTGPELMVRKALHKIGYRFRVNHKGLPGRPDILFSAKKIAIFVHGCFWHGHSCKVGSRKVLSNSEFWRAKMKKNQARDIRKAAELKELGYDVVTIWECELNENRWLKRLIHLLGPTKIH